MKMPKAAKKYCPRCRKHVEHKVSIYKKGKDRKMAQSKRRYDRKKSGYGSQPKPIQHNQCKVNKKTTPLYKCKVCGHGTYGTALRLKKFELVNQ